MSWIFNHGLAVQSQARCAITGWIFNRGLDLWSRVEKCNHGLNFESRVRFWITGWISNHGLDVQSRVEFLITGWMMCYSRLNVSSRVGIVIKSSWTILGHLLFFRMPLNPIRQTFLHRPYIFMPLLSFYRTSFNRLCSVHSESHIKHLFVAWKQKETKTFTVLRLGQSKTRNFI